MEKSNIEKDKYLFVLCHEQNAQGLVQAQAARVVPRDIDLAHLWVCYFVHAANLLGDSLWGSRLVSGSLHGRLVGSTL